MSDCKSLIWQEIALRWAYCILIGALLGAFVLAVGLIAGEGEPSLKELHLFVGSSWIKTGLASGLIFAVMAWTMHSHLKYRFMWRAMFGWAFAPGPLITGFLGAGLIGLLAAKHLSWNIIDYTIISAMSGFGWTAGRALCVCKGWTPKMQSEHSTTDIFSRDDPEQLIQWIVSDKPIQSGSEDKFGHEVVSQAIAKKILSTGMPSRNPDDSPSNVLLSGIVFGKRGIGKTSICNLLQQQLNSLGSGRRVVLSNLSAWEYADGGSLRRAIIRRFIECVGEAGSVWGLRQLPSAYAQAIGSGGGIWDRISGILSHEDDPEIIVRRIGERAQSLGIEVMIWIDDTERIQGGHEAAVDSLLYLVRHTRGIGFVLARSTDLSYNETDHTPDSHKLADFTHSIWINQEVILDLLGLMRHHCILHAKSKSIVLQVSTSSILSSLDVHDSQYNAKYFVGVVEPLARVIGTPRGLKACLRRIWRGWRVNGLAGEIDLDSFILFSALVECGEGLNIGNRHFEWNEFFGDHALMSSVCELLHGSNLSGNKSSAEAKGLDTRIAEFIRNRNPVSLNIHTSEDEFELLHSLFVRGSRDQQDFASRRGDKYIRRAINEGLGSSVANQPGLQLLRDMQDSMRTDSLRETMRSFVERWFDKEIGDVAIEGLGIFSDASLLRLVIDAVAEEAIRRSHTHVWRMGEHWEPIIDIARILRDRDVAAKDGSVGIDWALRAMRQRSLAMSHEFLYWWGPEHGLMHSTDWTKVSRKMLAAFLRGFRHHSAELATELQHSQRWILHWTICMEWVKGGPYHDPMIWRRAIPIIARAMDTDSQSVAVSVSTLLVGDKEARENISTVENINFVVKLCGNLTSRIMLGIFMIDVETGLVGFESSKRSNAVQVERRRLELAKAIAAQWLSEHSNEL